MKAQRFLKAGGVLFIIPFLFACAGSVGGVQTSRDHSVNPEESDNDEGGDPLAVFMGDDSAKDNVSATGERPDGVEYLINQDLALHGVPSEDKELPKLRSTLESSGSAGWRPRKGYDIPMVYNKQVERWVRTFSGPLRSHFALWLQRASRYGPLVEDILAEYQLPHDLIYLAMIESGFNLNAYSHASAAGPWQFIQSTGKLYGLDAGPYVDDRRDLEKATRAAAAHLRDLYNLYHDWYLAFAAYNAGAGGVNRAIRAGGTRDFWSLSEGKKRYLRQETKDYVPRILAAAYISKNYRKFGFPSSLFESASLTSEPVTVPDATDLSVIAECAGVSLEEVKELNPSLVVGMTPPKERFTVNLPTGTADDFERNYARVPKDQRVRFVYHKVQRKETLTRIAHHYGVSKSALAQANGLSAKLTTVKAGTLLVIPKKGVLPKLKLQPEKEIEVAEIEKGPLVALNDGEKGDLQVPSIPLPPAGDSNLPEPVAKLSPDLTPEEAQVAPVFVPEAGSGATSETTSKIYKVKRGDTLGSIAGRHGMSLASLRRLNGLGSKNVIKTGQVLKVSGEGEEKIEEPRVAAVADSLNEGESAVAPVSVKQAFEAAPAPTLSEPTLPEPVVAPQEQVIVHLVRRGETLYSLAKKYGVTIAQIKNWNRLNDTRLYPNQKIKIYAAAPMATAKKVALLSH